MPIRVSLLFIPGLFPRRTSSKTLGNQTSFTPFVVLSLHSLIRCRWNFEKASGFRDLRRVAMACGEKGNPTANVAALICCHKSGCFQFVYLAPCWIFRRCFPTGFRCTRSSSTNCLLGRVNSSKLLVFSESSCDLKCWTYVRLFQFSVLSTCERINTNLLFFWSFLRIFPVCSRSSFPLILALLPFLLLSLK